MKTWNSYGSEHSANLVMIGKFKDASSAAKAKEAIDEITEYMTSQDTEKAGPDRYSDDVMALLRKVGFTSPSPAELEQFVSDIRSELKGSQIVITTDEPDISAFLKLMVDKGARVEVYSGAYPEANGETKPES
ncbi:MAG: hypothetical protein JWM68_302 [Verrucomicrobiales bacterium]|nr:hypothetical protein [Verrucomicrobiales bacterium]